MSRDDPAQSAMRGLNRHVSLGHAIGRVPSLGEQLNEIMRDMDAAYAAIRAAGYPPMSSPEHVALEAVYIRLRTWNENLTQR